MTADSSGGVGLNDGRYLFHSPPIARVNEGSCADAWDRGRLARIPLRPGRPRSQGQVWLQVCWDRGRLARIPLRPGRPRSQGRTHLCFAHLPALVCHHRTDTSYRTSASCITSSRKFAPRRLKPTCQVCSYFTGDGGFFQFGNTMRSRICLTAHRVPQ